MDNDEQSRLLSLAALLHDVGKICYRAGKEKVDHSELGKRFFNKIALYNQPTSELTIISECIKHHHAAELKTNSLPTNHLAYIIYEADNIAAATDRRKDEGDKNSSFNMKAPLESIFNRLHGKTPVNKSYYLRSLDERAPINYSTTNGVVATAEKYRKLLEQLETDLGKTNLLTCSPNEILDLLESVLTFVPSSTDASEACDISLYDHSKLTAALALAMYLYFTANNIVDYASYCYGKKNAIFRQEKAFLMIAGNVSGIQDFIYTIPSAGALKSLRGRSFYLEIMVEHILDEFLTVIGLNRANVLYVGGGHFYIVAPNTPHVEKMIQQAQYNCNQSLLSLLGTSLSLQFSSRSCSAVDFMNQASKDGTRTNRVGAIFSDLAASLENNKFQRYESTQLQRLFTSDSTLNATKDTMRECAVCHTSTVTLVRFEPTDTQACELCAGLYDFGRKILERDGVYCVLTEKTKGGLPLPSVTGEIVQLHVLSHAEAKEYQQKNALRRMYIKNELSNRLLSGTHLWVADYAACGTTGTLQDFGSLVNTGAGIRRLGVLRADIDSLGATFVHGFVVDGTDPYRYATLSRNAVLSRQLSLFFKHYMNKFCSGQLQGDYQEVLPYSLWGQPKQDRSVNVVYSGGDDLFIVGEWETLLELAVDLYTGFAEFTGNKLTFSAGLAFFSEGYPITQMARLTGALEQQAKAQPGKNSIALFGNDDSCYDAPDDQDSVTQHVYSWPDFIGKVLGEKLTFLRQTLLIQADGKQQDRVLCTGSLRIGKTQLYRLMKIFSEDCGQQRIHIARLAYLLGRLEPSSDNVDYLTKAAYKAFRDTMYRWYLDSENRQETATALHLLIYGQRDR